MSSVANSGVQEMTPGVRDSSKLLYWSCCTRAEETQPLPRVVSRCVHSGECGVEGSDGGSTQVELGCLLLLSMWSLSLLLPCHPGGLGTFLLRPGHRRVFAGVGAWQGCHWKAS